MDPQADLAQLNGRDALDVLASTHGALAAMVDRTPAEVLRRRPFAGKWTPNEILGHLVDHEWASGVRYRNAMFAEPPSFVGYDQERWVAGRAVNEMEPRLHVEEFGLLRPHNLRLLSGLAPETLGRAVPLTSGGTATVRQLINRYAAHDLIHLDQLRRYVEASGRVSG